MRRMEGHGERNVLLGTYEALRRCDGEDLGILGADLEAELCSQVTKVVEPNRLCRLRADHDIAEEDGMLAETHLDGVACARHVQQTNLDTVLTLGQQRQSKGRDAVRGIEPELNICRLPRPQGDGVRRCPAHCMLRQLSLLVAQLKGHRPRGPVHEAHLPGDGLVAFRHAEVDVLHISVGELQFQRTAAATNIHVHSGVVVDDKLNALHVLAHLSWREHDGDTQGSTSFDHGSIELNIQPGFPCERRRDQAVAVVAVCGDQFHSLVPQVLGWRERLAGHCCTSSRNEAWPEVVAEE
mmetsp:Transcript_59038/g.138120  ORF Transcript_59038/g.138120 Transcript_59038/m.138120 type:complete len:296 (-) Transcript_59038:1175-2062(-)